MHGYPDSKEVWSEVAGRLADRFHVVLYDVRGHGRSTAPDPLRGGFTLEKLTDDFLAVADAVSPDRPVHLVGHDWGSVQGWEFATVGRTEGRIASFTSISGPCLDHFGHWIRRRVRRPTPRRAAQLLGQGAKSWYVYALHTPVLPELAWRGPLGRRWPKLLASGGEAARGQLPDRLAARGRGPRRLALPRQRPAAAGQSAPRRLRPCARCSSSRPTGDAFLSERLYDDLERWVPRLTRRTLPAKHWVPRTRPDQLARWITEFVTAHEFGGGPAGSATGGTAAAAVPGVLGKAGTAPGSGSAGSSSWSPARPAASAGPPRSPSPRRAPASSPSTGTPRARRAPRSCPG